MEQNFPEESPIPTPIAPTPITDTTKPVKSSGFIVVLLSILLIISVLIAGFFAYQTQNLVKQITELQPTPTPIASTEPSPTTDPSADWQTFTNKELGFEIKYPKNFTISSGLIPNNGTQITLISDQRNILIINKPNINPLTNKKYESLEQFDPRVKNFKLIMIGQYEAKDSGIYDTQGGTTQRDLIMEKDDSIWIIQDLQKEELTNEIFDQIISTFKFIEPKASIMPSTSPQP